MQVDMEIFKGFAVFLSRKKSQQEFDTKKDFVVLFKWGEFPKIHSICSMGCAICVQVLQLMSHWLAAPRARLEQSAGGMLGTAIRNFAPTCPRMECDL